jgi:cyclopropane-fatty-acyl-phospholipid synthase
MLQTENKTDSSPGYAIAFQNGEQQATGPGAPSFKISVADKAHLERILNADAYAGAMAFVRGEVSISGDLVAAVRAMSRVKACSFLHRLWTVAARLVRASLETYFQSRTRAAENIRFHYDRSNDFYGKFLDSHLVYSSALFIDPNWSLEEAQSAKLDLICRKLQLRPGDRFLDVGCGWGALMIHAAEQYGVYASGCTLSRNQYEYAGSTIAARGLERRAQVLEMDYRCLSGRFRKIASIGMFEHVGRNRLEDYFRTVCRLLEDDGLFLNSGITRPQRIRDDPETYFLQEEVFPGGELEHLCDVVRYAENAGFEVLELESIRVHYGRTCREWVKRLQRNAKSCEESVGERTYRIWLLYLAASAMNFEDGQTDAYQILMAKRGAGSPSDSISRII